MTSLTTLSIKHERFCVEYRKSANATDAYRIVYDTGHLNQKSVNQAASRLLKKVNIQARIEELGQEVTKTSMMSFEKHLEDLMKIRNAAFADKKWATAMQTEHLRGQASGYYTQKTELTGAGGKDLMAQYVLNLGNATDAQVDSYLRKSGLIGEGYDPNP
jgi:hypothetical protein